MCRIFMFQFIVATFLALSLAACGGGGGNGSVTPGALNVVATTFEASCADGTKPTSTVSMDEARGKCVGHGGTDTIEMPCIDPVSKTFSTCHTKIGPIVNDPLPVASTYAADSEELAAFNLLNKERSWCGFGTLKQNAALDQAAKNHADWQNFNLYFSHFESPLYPDKFTANAPYDREVLAGYVFGLGGSGSEAFVNWPFSVTKKGKGTESVRGLLNAPYHMRGILEGYQDVGVAVRDSVDVNKTTNTAVAQYQFAYTSSKGIASQTSSEVRTYPCEGTTGTDYKLTAEEPNPVPGRDLRTNPLGGSVLVQLRYGNKLAFTSATMTQVSGDGAGTAVTLRDPVTSANSGNAFLSHQGYIVADAPLLPNTAYQVLINGTNNGTAFSRQFTFTTGTGG